MSINISTSWSKKVELGARSVAVERGYLSTMMNGLVVFFKSPQIRGLLLACI